MKRDAADKAFSDFIREFYEWRCTRCGKEYGQGRRQGLHCSHLVSRRHQSCRYYSGAAVAHCFSCHQYLGGNPLEFAAWIEDFIGGEAAEALLKRKNKICKRTKKDKKEIARHWRAQTEYLKRCREEGKEFHVMEWD